MSNHIERAAFAGHNINIIMHQGEPHMSGEAIGQALGYANPRKAIHKIYERNQEMLGDYSTVVKMGTVDGKHRATRIYSEQGMMFITMKSNQPAAFPFQRWGIDVMHRCRHERLAVPERLVALEKELSRQALAGNPQWRKIKRYKGLGLSHHEIGKLLDITGRTVTKRVREMEACGLLTPPANLALWQRCVETNLHPEVAHV